MRRFSADALARIGTRLNQLEHADYRPLVEKWEDVIRDDNRRGVLAGLDRSGAPLAPVKYRPVVGAAGGKVRNLKKDRGYKGIGHARGNLSSAEYRKLTGPPLAPRGSNSRVITNLVTRSSTRPVNGVWFAEGAWIDIVSMKGVSFLPFHLLGSGRLPKRDIAGVRPEGREKARNQLRRFARALAKNQGGFAFYEGI